MNQKKHGPWAERLVSRLTRDEESGCWLWTGPVAGNGYGYLADAGGHRLISAHRASFRLFGGPLKDGLELDHLCRNKLCCNPDHLEQVTHRVNVLRGSSLFAAYARRTHCQNGHQYSDKSTRVGPAGGRTCRICDRETKRLSASTEAGRARNKANLARWHNRRRVAKRRLLQQCKFE